MSDDKPMFVKIRSRGRYQIKPYSGRGWAVMGAWMVVNTAILCLLIVPAIREQWWLVIALELLVLVPFLLSGIRNAVPIEQVRQAKES